MITGALLLSILLTGAPQDGPIRVCLRNLAFADGDTVTLGDVATFENADAEATDALSSIQLAAAPEPAQAMLLQKKDVRLFLVRHGIDSRHVILEGRESVPVVREGIIVTSDDILEAIRELVAEETGWAGEDFALDQVRGLKDVNLPPGPAEIAVESLAGCLTRDPLFRVSILRNGAVAATLQISARLARYVDTWLCGRDLSRGERFSEDNVKPGRIDINSLSNRQQEGLIRSLESITGCEARYAIAEGKPLTADMIVAPTVVERGERVTLEMLTGTIRITGPGIARQSGRIGQSLRVENLANGKFVFGRVTAPGVVTID